MSWHWCHELNQSQLDMLIRPTRARQKIDGTEKNNAQIPAKSNTKTHKRGTVFKPYRRGICNTQCAIGNAPTKSWLNISLIIPSAKQRPRSNLVQMESWLNPSAKCFGADVMKSL